jgi:hypothetical protein
MEGKYRKTKTRLVGTRIHFSSMRANFNNMEGKYPTIKAKFPIMKIKSPIWAAKLAKTQNPISIKTNKQILENKYSDWETK